MKNDLLSVYLKLNRGIVIDQQELEADFSAIVSLVEHFGFN